MKKGVDKMGLDGLSLLGEVWKAYKRAVKPDSGPARGDTP